MIVHIYVVHSTYARTVARIVIIVIMINSHERVKWLNKWCTIEVIIIA